ncbi:DUF3365 domain-containing protein [Oleiharenicola sp. Vm1]|uniref:c-type heme family protein n=1 Tax=Oleiharenicola sp. Vm1 TaxID=3398393 RepID=UPI0039F47C1A
MKNAAYPVVFACLGACLWAQEPAKPPLKFAWAPADDPLTATVRSAGEKLIDRIGGSLLIEVERTLATKGLDEAVELMHLKSLAPPRPLEGKPRVTAIKLTSFRVREPRNTPDEADFAALDLVRTALNAGEAPPKVIVQTVDAADTPTEWRVYRPIAVSPKCLLCHGNSDSLQPQVRYMLERLYPEDKATGYSAWEWRGLIRVSYAAPVPPAPAKTN